jgi:hypothetical protein
VAGTDIDVDISPPNIKGAEAGLVLLRNTIEIL